MNELTVFSKQYTVFRSRNELPVTKVPPSAFSIG